MTPNDFINKIAPAAMEDMRRTKISAALTIAQAILESNWGKSGLTVRANNLFGIKGTGPAGSVTMPTKEFSGGKWITVNAPFRKYANWGQSIADHSKLILNGVSWNRKLYHKVINADWRSACYEIAAAGYATDPGYPGKLINLIETYGLWKYDEQVEGEERMLQELKETVKQLSKENAQMKNRLSALEKSNSMPTPEWAKAAVKAAVKKKIIDTPDGGSYDFYRVLTVLHRQGLI